MTQLELFKKVIEILNKLNLPYMITGAYAVSFYGEPRATHDIDFKIKIGLKNVEDFYNSFKNKFYISRESIHQAIKHKSMFNIIHFESNIKIDFWLFKNNEFDKERLKRRRKVTILKKPVFISSPEDIILIKLKWFKESELEKHFFDALGIMKVQGKDLDFKYLDTWAERLNVKNLLIELKK